MRLDEENSIGWIIFHCWLDSWCNHVVGPEILIPRSTPYLQRGSALLSVDNRRLYCFKEAQRTLKKHGITVPLREGWELRLGNLLQSWGIGVMDGKDHVTLGVVGMKAIGDFWSWFRIACQNWKVQRQTEIAKEWRSLILDFVYLYLYIYTYTVQIISQFSEFNLMRFTRSQGTLTD